MTFVSDYQMPETDGLQFLKELREKGNRISFVFLVGKAGMKSALKLWVLGLIGTSAKSVRHKQSIESCHTELNQPLREQ